MKINKTQEKIADVIRRRIESVEDSLLLESEKIHLLRVLKQLTENFSKIFEEEDNLFNPEAFEKRCKVGVRE